MTYQATRNVGANYSGHAGYGYVPAGRAQRVSQNSRNAAAARRAEERRRRDAEYRRAAEADAQVARYMEIRRRRHEAELARIKAREAKLKREQAAALKAERAKEKEAARLAEEAFRRNEIRVARQKMPWQFILGVASAFVLLMAVVFSFAQISETNAELAAVKSEISATVDQADKLRVRIEEKNDLTEIERLAVEEYNMVKEGSVQKKYIYISDGDKVVLESGETEEDNSGFVGGMLSSASSVFDDLLDYIK